MYHEVTYSEIARRRRERIGYVLVVCVIILAVAFSVSQMMEVARGQSSESVKQAVVKEAVRCLAVEGSYPATLEYLESEYGLVINHEDYDVVYEWLGDNVPPSVVVRLR